MSQVFFCSDTHFGHAQPFIYEDRGFDTVEEMNETIVKNWNSVVGPDDTVYLLGDVIMGGITNIKYLARLNGHIEIIAGNHDSDRRIDEYCKLPNITFHGYGDIYKTKKRTFYLSHHQQIMKNGDSVYIPWNIHGHTHSKEKFSEYDHCYNVSLDAHNCTPVSLDQIMLDIDNHKKEKAEVKKQSFLKKIFKIK